MGGACEILGGWESEVPEYSSVNLASASRVSPMRLVLTGWSFGDKERFLWFSIFLGFEEAQSEGVDGGEVSWEKLEDME